MAEFLSDFRYSLRSLRKSPGFAAVAVITLALGIGANTAIFSVVNGVVLKPLRYGQPEQLVFIATQFPTLGFDEFWMSPPEFLDLREWNRSFTSMGGYRAGNASIGADERPLQVPSSIATWELFSTLGVAPAMGRTWDEVEDRPGAEPIVVLSWDLWRSAFGADPQIIGRMVLVNGAQREVIGVMPEGFDLDDAGIQVWLPSNIDPTNRQNRGSHYLDVVARLRPGVTLEGARAEMATLIQRSGVEFEGQHPFDPNLHPVILNDLQDQAIGSIRPALLLLLGAVGFVLLIACANVGNLLLARAESRQKEIAVRSALGAGRSRLVRQFLTESVVLALIGGVVGLFFAWAGLRVLLASSPGSIPRIDEIALDGRVLLFTLAISVLTGLLFGMAPLLHTTAGTVNASLREGGQRTTAGKVRMRLRRLLVVSEVALAVMLVVGSGLMLRSFAALQNVDAGFDTEGILTFGLFLPGSSYQDGMAQLAFHERLAAELRALPGVRSVAAMSGLPPQRQVLANDMVIEDYNFQPNTGMAPPNADHWQFATADYLETMGIEIASGRGFTAADGPAAPPVALINEAFARVFYKDMDPVGRRLRPSLATPGPWLTIVGVVKDVKQSGLDEEAGTEVYYHYPQAAALGGVPRAMNVVVRTERDPLSLLDAARTQVAAIDPTLPVSNPRSMETVVNASVAQPRFLTLLLGIFAAVALSLAAVGTYGVMSYNVAERRQEIGIRMALGARQGEVLGMVLAQGLIVAGAGLLLGVAGALGLTRFLSSMLYGVGARDSVAFIAAPLMLALVATAACAIPALRATRVDPARTLRQD